MSKFLLGLGLVSFLLSHPFVLAGGREGGNGGDACERRFKAIGADLNDWLLKNGDHALQMPSGIDLRSYHARMLHAYAQAEVSCTNQHLSIGRSEKTCLNYKEDDQNRILCNRDLFLGTDQTEQYVLVHHEYAGVAAIEVNDGDASNYFISNQIAEALSQHSVLRINLQHEVESSLIEDASVFKLDLFALRLQLDQDVSITANNSVIYQKNQTIYLKRAYAENWDLKTRTLTVSNLAYDPYLYSDDWRYKHSLLLQISGDDEVRKIKIHSESDILTIRELRAALAPYHYTLENVSLILLPSR